MTAERTIFLFKHDIGCTIAETTSRMVVLHNGDMDKVKDAVDFRLRAVWKITLDEWQTITGM